MTQLYKYIEFDGNSYQGYNDKNEATGALVDASGLQKLFNTTHRKDTQGVAHAMQPILPFNNFKAYVRT